jgi:hypothetical protein
VDGGNRQRSGATVTNLALGNHIISFNTVNGWRTPTNQVVEVGFDSTAMASGVYVAIGSLQVTLGPAPAVAGGAQWQVDYGTWQDSRATVTNLAVGNHMVSFRGIDYWTAPGNQTVPIKAKAVTKATGTYTFNAQGTYNGLFAQPDTNIATSGMLSDLAVRASGTYTAKLLLGQSTNAINGAFNASGQGSNIVPRAAKLGGPLTLSLWVNWNNSPLTIAGTVSGTNGGAWTANLTAELAAGGSGSAAYTALLSPDGTPPGSGYLLMNAQNGTMTLGGALADGNSLGQVVPVSGAGDLPVYGNLYGGTGVVIGWIGLEGGSPAGSLTWIKEASRSSARYPNGFTNLLVVRGSPWTNHSTSHEAAIDLPAGQLELSGGGLPTPLTFNVAVSNNNNLVKLTGSPANSLSGSINAATGLLKVTFGDNNKETTGYGAVLQNQTNGGGYFLTTSNAGAILLQP